MSKILHVAWREFVATVLTKGFILGMLMTPALIGLVLLVLPSLIDEEPPKIDGELALIDPSGVLSEGIRDYLRPEEVARRRAEFAKKIDEVMPVRAFGGDEITSMAMDQAIENALGSVPEIAITELPANADVEAEKEPLLEGTPQDGGRLALVVAHEDAVEPGADGEYGAYDLFVREKLDDRLVDEIRDAVGESIVAQRARSRDLDPQEIVTLTHVARARAIAVSEEGERESNELTNMLLPMGFMLLLMMSVLTGGQYLMTSTIEEKSSRVVEVLLSAVSPMELMTGKILGQMGVGFLVLALYAGMGIAGLVAFSFLGLLEFHLVIYLVLFYLIAYFVLGSFMAAIGAAVNEMREAQTLMMPIMFAVMIPWMLWLPISRDPNSVFAVVMSFLPPINTFGMLLRLTSSTPPPTWQVWLSIAIGIASVFAALWFAAKVFRVGILLHGKPPNFATLVRWVRMA